MRIHAAGQHGAACAVDDDRPVHRPDVVPAADSSGPDPDDDAILDPDANPPLRLAAGGVEDGDVEDDDASRTSRGGWVVGSVVFMLEWS